MRRRREWTEGFERERERGFDWGASRGQEMAHQKGLLMVRCTHRRERERERELTQD